MAESLLYFVVVELHLALVALLLLLQELQIGFLLELEQFLFLQELLLLPEYLL